MYGDRIKTHDKVEYTANPNFPMAPAWAKMMGELYVTRFPLINDARKEGNKLDKDPFCNDYHLFKVDKGVFCADKLVPCTQSLLAFQGMTVDECRAYSKSVDGHCDAFLTACRAFEETPNMANWKAYREEFKFIYAALWNNFFYRIYMKEQSSTFAN